MAVSTANTAGLLKLCGLRTDLSDGSFATGASAHLLDIMHVFIFSEVARRARQSAWHPRSFQGLTIRSGWRAQESELVADWPLIVPPPAPARCLLEAKSTA
jgi:hypothetical protein